MCSFILVIKVYNSHAPESTYGSYGLMILRRSDDEGDEFHVLFICPFYSQV